MVDATKSKGVQRSCDKIADIVSHDEHLSAGQMDLRALSQQLCKMPDRDKREVPVWAIDTLFKAAESKMKDDGDKQTLANLRKCVL